MLKSLDITIRQIWGAAAFAAAYALAAVLALEGTQTANGIAIVWPSSGVFVAGLLLLRGNARFVLMALAGAASIAVNIGYGMGAAVSAGFTVANILEAAIATRFVCDGKRACVQFENPRWVLRFATGALCAALTSASVAYAVIWVSSGDVGANFWPSWFSTVLLGILIVTPAIVTFVRALAGAVRPDTDTVAKFAVVALLGSASVAVTFFQTEYPLLFLPLAVTVLATFLLGVAGAVCMVLLVALIGSVAVLKGYSPIAFVENPTASIYFFQVYLLTVFASALPLATLLAKSRHQADDVERSHRLLQTAERVAHVGHWHFKLEEGELFWSEELYRIHGLDPALPITLEQAVAVYAEDDQAVVRQALDEAILDRAPFRFEARIQRGDGEFRHVESHGEVEVENGEVVAVFGVFLDITDTVLAMNSLAVAREQAEQQADEALRLSETDQLTDVANRRKLMVSLKQGMVEAELLGEDLAVVMIDVDHFKAINDTHGHAVGDVVLQKIARTCAGCLRGNDTFGRLGGEEFLAILPGANKEMASMVAERLRCAVTLLANDPEVPMEEVSVSLGVAIHQKGADESFILQAADAALYESKAAGRNRFTVAA